MTTATRDIVSCPFCGADAIRGSDQCDACGMDLAGIDIPETALNISDSHFSVPIAEVRVARASTVEASASVRAAIAIVAADPSGAAVVLDDGHVVGIFTERDVLKKVAGNPAVLDAPVTTCMTPDPVVLREDDPMAAALHKMGAGGFRHIPLVRDGELVGVVTARDALLWLLSRYFG